MSEDLKDEIEMVKGMFADVCEQSESNTLELIVHLPFRFELEVALPRKGYPEECHPTLYVSSGPNTHLLAEFTEELEQRMKSEIPLGGPHLANVIMLAQEIAEEMQTKKEAEDAEKVQQEEEMQEAIDAHLEEMEQTALEIWSGEVITDRKSKFVAHMAPVSSLEDVQEVVQYLRRQRHISVAAHPTIYAYRFRDENGILHQDCDDDEEGGASIKMMFLLDKMDVDGYIVVVTRWWGGILLGPDRFKHIMTVTKNILLTIPEREKSWKQGKK